MKRVDQKFEEYLIQAAAKEAPSIHQPEHWIGEIAELYSGHSDKSELIRYLPWSRTQDQFCWRPAELTIHGGMSSHRKSMMLGWLMAHVAKDTRVAIASLEMEPPATIMRMLRQCVGVAKPSEKALQDFLVWANADRFWLYAEVDKVPWKRILGFVYYCAMELNCLHIVIDSLTKCGIAPGDGENEKDFIDRLQWAAKTLGCHIHLVAHVRKPQHADDGYIPNKYDIRGQSEITDLADNVLIHWMDKRRAKLLDIQDKYPQQLNAADSAYLADPKKCDQKIIVAKQRHGQWEGTINLYFDQNSLQFVSDEGRRMPFDYGQKLEVAA